MSATMLYVLKHSIYAALKLTDPKVLGCSEVTMAKGELL
jgi:hypothetical protein